MNDEIEVVVAQMRIRLAEMAARPEWAGWLKTASVLAPHSGRNQGQVNDSYRWESKIALWGTEEQWHNLGYTIQAKAEPRLVLIDAKRPGKGWELIFSEKEAVATEGACALRAPKGSKWTAKTTPERGQKDPAEAISTLEFLLQVEGWKLFRRPDDRGAEAYCKFEEKKIWVARSGDLWTDFHRMAHEVGHVLLHQAELEPAVWEGEIEAEAVAMLFGQVLEAEIAEETARYMLCRSTGHPGEWESFQVEDVAFAPRVVEAVEAALATIGDLRPEVRARRATSIEESEIVDEPIGINLA
jgi:hypothetical protein